MVSGYDKLPPPDRQEPGFGWGGRLVVVVLVMVIGIIGFGWDIL